MADPRAAAAKKVEIVMEVVAAEIAELRPKIDEAKATAAAPPADGEDEGAKMAREGAADYAKQQQPLLDALEKRLADATAKAGAEPAPEEAAGGVDAMPQVESPAAGAPAAEPAAAAAEPEPGSEAAPAGEPEPAAEAEPGAEPEPGADPGAAAEPGAAAAVAAAAAVDTDADAEKAALQADIDDTKAKIVRAPTRKFPRDGRPCLVRVGASMPPSFGFSRIRRMSSKRRCRKLRMKVSNGASCSCLGQHGGPASCSCRQLCR